jgi:deoxyribodipyrimidine photo-lyase
MTSSPSIWWLRRDLRLQDNPALLAAASEPRPLLPVYVWDAEREPRQTGAAARWWLRRSLATLDAELRARGSRLLVIRGPAAPALAAVARAAGAERLHYGLTLDPGEPAAVELARALAAAGARLEVTAHSPNLVFGPPFPLTAGGTPFHVFTPFWRACLATGAPARPLPSPRIPPFPAPPAPVDAAGPAASTARPPAATGGPDSGEWPGELSLEALDREVERPWTEGFAAGWTPGETGARERLARFTERPLAGYDELRDRPDLDATSRLSPHLHFGEISTRTVWLAAAEAAIGAGSVAGPEAYQRQLVWREFAHQLLTDRPDTVEQPLHQEFRHFPWRDDDADLAAWQQARTGYPLVDAGMRQLWTTGWMHNRVRLVCASFLTKGLLLPWQDGARWFWDTLLDADLANNTLGWQWVAGSGADAAPYFRIFNPVTQGARHDPGGAYVRRWLPELAALPDKWLQSPWAAPEAALAAAGVRLVGQEVTAEERRGAHGPAPFTGGAYPEPLIDHVAARRRALDAYRTMRERAAGT